MEDRLELVTDEGEPFSEETPEPIPHSEQCCPGCKATLDGINENLAAISTTFTEGVNGAMEQLSEGGIGGIMKALMGR